MTLQGKVAVVTGGGRGIGRAITDGLRQEGARVVVIELHWTGIEEFRDELQADPDTLPLIADVVIDDQLEKAYQSTIGNFGTVDIIVNNAAYRQRDVTPSGRIATLDIPPEHWRKMLDINTTGPWNVIRHFVPPMLTRKSGSIVNVSSYGGDRGRPGDEPYGMSKAAFTNWSQALAEELKPFNISCNIFSPEGTMTTGWAERQQALQQQGPSSLPRRASSTSRVLKPESCVPLVLFLAQQDASVTGFYINHVLDWNKLHGLGGDDVWAADYPTDSNR